jgi:lipopolysaccharide/colanic/teichoic acid biosynthesis glycosyltransferase
MVAKRLFDLACAGLAVIVLIPIWIIVALAVKMSSPGPVLFRQQRVGRHGKPFRVLKFRTMRAGSGGPQITARGDARITAFGRALRKTKLDETPQLLNVIVGDMSLVGPRPEVPQYVDLYPDLERARILSLRPGLTDPATLVFRNEEQLLAEHADPVRAYRELILPQKVRAYVDYVESRTFWGDVTLVWKTLGAVLFP